MSITGEQRAKLLQELKSGRDLLDAADKTGIDPEAVRADAELLREAELAFATATSKLQSKLVEKCLRGGPADITTLERMIEGRAGVQRAQFKPATVAEDGGPDWSQLNVSELLIIEALLRNDVEEARRLIREDAVGLAAEMAREMARALVREQQPPQQQLDELAVLDESAPLPRSKAMIAIGAR